MKENYSEFRNKACDWLNSRKKDYSAGVQLLIEYGYKKNVMRELQRKGERPHTLEKLTYEMRQFVYLWSNPESPEHADITDPEKTEVRDTDRDTETPGLKPQLIIGSDVQENESYPVVINKLIRILQAYYQKRSILHGLLSEVPDTNDAPDVEKRLDILKEINIKSTVMDYIYPFIREYKENGTIPDETAIAAEIERITQLTITEPGDTSNDQGDANTDPADETLPDNVEELKKLKKALQTKKSKANNRLLYQNDKKQEKENPLPPCPDRAKYEAQIAAIDKKVEEIDYKIVELNAV